jgi:hypothetical protein
MHRKGPVSDCPGLGHCPPGDFAVLELVVGMTPSHLSRRDLGSVNKQSCGVLKLAVAPGERVAQSWESGKPRISWDASQAMTFNSCTSTHSEVNPNKTLFFFLHLMFFIY